ncbi:hypothetical protein SARC_04906 [Sphaeroforma arctica JP610]|uniref:Multidrug resistance protein 1 n=1 Tax=Sphaeroforma arctica JP610 TaxID=667725 RepID=A0A0L0G3N9_9EUKA|nr:hypothetical protein SARC_04906 [Sphaeroforma arctica JP610]KNC82823.1 hypothetical protein SARC_04906 [Sphaeroforma arctica JP610]|eukprot:XP_014156725.1 hypothetical protein SARC_04906 [Sphaeroforma arctica JP610]
MYTYDAIDDLGGRKPKRKWGKKKDKKTKEDDKNKVPDDEEAVDIGFKDMFIMATKKDWYLMLLGAITSGVAGVAFPFFGLLLGDTMDGFYPTYQPDVVKDASLNFFYFAIVLFLTSFLGYACFAVAAANQVEILRAEALRATLKQELGWYDVREPTQLSSRIAGDTVLIQGAIGQKLSEFIKYICQFFGGFILGFVKGWKMALMMCAGLPVMIIAFGALGVAIKIITEQQQTAYAKAGGVAEETFSSMRTVASLSAEKTQTERYEGFVAGAEKVAIKAGLLLALSLGFIFMIIFLTYALGWWWGGYLISNDDPNIQSVGDVTNVFFSFMMGTMAIAQVGPNFTSILEGRGAMESIMRILKRNPRIPEDGGAKPDSTAGVIEFKDITFVYPSRPDQVILKNFNLKVKPGQTVALVGASGSGKSTAIGMLQRFYEPIQGSVLLDGQDIKGLDTYWLRGQMGLVGQEPSLFHGTIAENIAFGKGDISTVSMDDIVQAAKDANAYNYIMQFPNGFDTLVGEKGVQLSGGQKQRIAIARAIIRRPQILLLDEATSALDTESERIVQAALDGLMDDNNRTCLVVAHRLTTIRNADVIACFKDGKIHEQGTHDELMKIKDGVYYGLIELQMGKAYTDQLADGDDSDSDEDKEPDLDEPVPAGFDENMVPNVRKASAFATDIARKISQMGGSRTSSVKSRHSVLHTSQSTKSRGEDSNVGLTEEDPEAQPVDEGAQGWELTRRIWSLNKPVRMFMILGMFAAALNGAVFPVMSVMLTNIINVLGTAPKETLYDQMSAAALDFVILAIVAGVLMFFQTYIFSYAGEKLVTRLRVMTFSNLIRQDIAFFDDESNNTGSLTARLATDATLVKDVSGQNQGRIVQNMSTLVTAMVIAFVLGSWKVTLVLLALFPLLIGVSTLQIKFIQAGAKDANDSVAASGKLATEAVGNIRTVKAFGLQRPIAANYQTALQTNTKETVKKGMIGGFSVGMTQFISFGGYALVFWYGGTLVGKGEITFDECLKSLMAIMFAAMGLAQTSSFMTDSTAANDAARKIFMVVDRVPDIDISSFEGAQPKATQGHIEVKNVHFKYPSRPLQRILKGYNLDIGEGQTVALVGESGSGKSTIISLVERFYDPNAGQVYLDGVDLTELNVNWLRSQVGLVGQEPVLFGGTIMSNIATGKPGATSEEVVNAAKSANAHNFIMDFPDGYETLVGDRGAQLSGGQKQRVAIARAIIQNPRILLLDEATSALDAESERVVQDALDKLLAAQRRTTIIVAHRLTTIKNADKIAVIKNGVIVEQGKFDELVAMGGEFAKLNAVQPV